MLNFIKQSVFTRDRSDKDIEDTTPDGGLVALWGNPGSGSSTVSVKLAEYLARQGYPTLLLFADMTTPMIPCICPSGDLEGNYSLGSILAATQVTTSLVQHNCVTHKQLSNLLLLGLRRGENEYTYPPYNREQAEGLLKSALEIAPFVIVDCGTNIANDVLSAVALLKADSVLQLISSDLKAISYFTSQVPILKSAGWKDEYSTRIMSNVKPYQASEHAQSLFGTAPFTLPHSPELEEQFLAGDLLRPLSLKASRAFNTGIQDIAKEVFGC